MKTDSSRGFLPTQREYVVNIFVIGFQVLYLIYVQKADRVPKGLISSSRHEQVAAAGALGGTSSDAIHRSVAS